MERMRIVTTVLLGLIIAFGVITTASADPKGMWLTLGGKSHVEMELCGDKLCGTIVWLKDPNDEEGKAKVDVNNKNEALRSRPILGLKMLSNFVDKGAGKWEKGKIYNPEDGKTYNSKLELVDSNILKVSGCVLFFCKTQIWIRVE